MLMPEMQCHALPCSRYQLQAFCRAVFFLKLGQINFYPNETHHVKCDEKREMVIL